MASTNTEITKLRNKIKNYRPGDTFLHRPDIEFPETLHIALFGLVGCGKSSLMNSLMYAVQEEWKRTRWIQISNRDIMGGHTMRRTRLQVTNTVYIVDNRGIGNPTKETLRDEMKSQLAGKRSYEHNVDWEGQTVSKGEKGDPINTAVFVYSADQNISPEVYELGKLVNQMHDLQGHYPVAVITHIDTAGAAKVEQLRAHLRSFGISDVFTVANITDKKENLEEDYQRTLLNFLDRCMTDGDRNMEFRQRLKDQESKCSLM